MKGIYTPGGIYYPDKMKIEVSGVDPNGYTIPGDRFGDRSVLVSPDDSGVEQEILRTIYDVLVDVLPYGLSAVVKNTQTEGGATTNFNDEKAWAEWRLPLGQEPGWNKEKGMRFGYKLNVDPTLEGTYTINIHYYAEIWCYIDVVSILVHTFHLYDTITYEYVNTPPPPSKPSGYTSGYVGVSYSTSTTDPNGDSLRYEFNWADGSTTLTGWYTSGATASASHTWSSAGTYSVKVRAQDSTGAWSDWSSSLTVSISSGGGGGGGCPTLFVWDGSAFVEEGLLDIHAESDVTMTWTIHNALALENGLYRLQLRELDNFTSHIDYVRLYAIDKQGNWHELTLEGKGRAIQRLLYDDGDRLDLPPGETIDLKFSPTFQGEIAYFIFEINGYNIKLLM